MNVVVLLFVSFYPLSIKTMSMENKTVLTANEKVEQYDAMDQRPLSRNTVTINVPILTISIK